jgi:ribosomal protein S18 acetylase RimI-like enzyme
MSMALVPWRPEDVKQRIGDIISVYGETLGSTESSRDSLRRNILDDIHCSGFKAVATLTSCGELVAFAYGFRLHPHHWWQQNVQVVLDENQRKVWLTRCFEIAEIHVRPAAQAQGVGSRQLRALLAISRGTTALLCTTETAEPSSPAWRLYRKMGFVDVVRNFQFYGSQKFSAVLGLQLDRPLGCGRVPDRAAMPGATPGVGMPQAGR